MRTRRLFIAAIPPPQTALELHQALPSELPAAFRAVPVDQIHLTLQFIGTVRESHLDATIVSMTQGLAGLGPQLILPQRIATFPVGPIARLIAAVATCDPQLQEAHRRLAQRLARSTPHARPDQFEPHFTLARCSPPQPGFTLDLKCTIAAFTISRICLFESLLSPTGSHYRPVHEIVLQD